MFAMDRVRALAPKHPDWKTKQPFKAVLDRDIKALAALGETGFLRIMAVNHNRITSGDFIKIVADWVNTARHPPFHPLSSTSRCCDSLLFCAPTVSRLLSSPAAASNLCVSLPNGSMAFRLRLV